MPGGRLVGLQANFHTFINRVTVRVNYNRGSIGNGRVIYHTDTGFRVFV